VTLLGRIVLLQVQRQALKIDGVGYDPAPLLPCTAIALGPDGILGDHDGGWVVDVHGAGHPRSRGGGRRALSVGFTSHYRAIAARYGEVPLGVAGENLIVETDEPIRPASLAGTIVIETAQGSVELSGARVAAPCREFTSYLLGRTDVAPRGEIAADLEFLADGMRGYVFSTGHLRGWTEVRTGDRLWVRAA
jgi:hypothetical protein